MPIEGGEPQLVAETVTEGQLLAALGFALSPDGKQLLFAVERTTQITYFSNDKIQSFEYSPDGKQLGMLRLPVESDVVILRDAGFTAE